MIYAENSQIESNRKQIENFLSRAFFRHLFCALHSAQTICMRCWFNISMH